MTLILDYYRELPRPNSGKDLAQWSKIFQAGLGLFEHQVRQRYTEGTLLRLLASPQPELRQAAVLALGQIGTMAVNTHVATRLHNEDCLVRAMACDALWSIWFRDDLPEHQKELQRLVRLGKKNDKTAGSDVALAGLAALIRLGTQLCRSVQPTGHHPYSPR